MESVNHSRIKYVFNTAVRRIVENEPKPNLMEYFLHLEGSWESIFIGYEKPDMKPGDRIKVTIEKVS